VKLQKLEFIKML